MAIGINPRRLAIAGTLFIVLVVLQFFHLPLQAEIVGIQLYQKALSPLLGRVVTCRYELTCSHYALKVLHEDGFVKGNGKLAARLAMCSPAGWLYDQLSGRYPES